MKYYVGTRDAEGTAHVHIQNEQRIRPLSLRLDIVNHSPTGFEWGYGGSGPAQLALAILADALRNKQRADLLHQTFKWEKIATLDKDAEWRMSLDDVLVWVKENHLEEARKRERALP